MPEAALPSNCPKCKWGISQAMIDKADASARCRRCGMRLGEIVSLLKRQQEIANAPPPTLEEALLEKTGFPVWLGVLLVVTVLSFAAIGGLFFRDSARAKEQRLASADHAELLERYQNEISSMLQEVSKVNKVSAEFSIGDAIDDLTMLLKRQPENMDEETIAAVNDAEMRLSELMQIHSDK